VSRFLRLPPVPNLPAEIRGKSFALVEAFHLGEPAKADELLTLLRALGPVNDTIRTITMPDLLRVHMDPDQPVAGLGDGLTIASLPDEGAVPDVRGRNDFYLGPESASDRGGRGGRGCARALGGATYVLELLCDIPASGHAVDRAHLSPATTHQSQRRPPVTGADQRSTRCTAPRAPASFTYADTAATG
jgi:hypothetical protein